MIRNFSRKSLRCNAVFLMAARQKMQEETFLPSAITTANAGNAISDRKCQTGEKETITYVSLLTAYGQQFPADLTVAQISSLITPFPTFTCRINNVQ
jgi:hypothetical protein